MNKTTGAAAVVAAMIGTVAGVAMQIARPADLCVNSHPAKRSGYVTYGGVEPRYGYVRDHIVPLELGGSDVAANIQYQTYADAAAKDAVEHQAGRQYCQGRISLESALSMVARWREITK